MVMAIFYGLAAFGLILCLIQVAAVRSCVRNRVCKASGFTPPVSILKPLKGIDDNLFDNLESFCNLDYPDYELILALRSPDDPAFKVARKIKDKYPDRDIKIVAEWCEDGLNPKVNNLVPAYRVSRYPFILISDSNVLVGKDYLMDTMAQMEDPDVGLVSNMIRGVRGRTLGSVFENLHLNTFIAGSVSFFDRFLKRPCVVGKSMFLRREYLDRLGGFRAVKDHLAEDYIIGRRMREMGKKVVLSSYAIETVNEYWQVRQFVARHSRWGKLRWRIGGPAYLQELIANPVVMSAVPLALAGHSWLTLSAPVIVWSFKVALDYAMGRLIGADLHPAHYFLSPVKDLVIGVVWFVPIFSNKVEWRGDRYIIGKDSHLYPCQEGPSKSVVAY